MLPVFYTLAWSFVFADQLSSRNLSNINSWWPKFKWFVQHNSYRSEFTDTEVEIWVEKTFTEKPDNLILFSKLDTDHVFSLLLHFSCLRPHDLYTKLIYDRWLLNAESEKLAVFLLINYRKQTNQKCFFFQNSSSLPINKHFFHKKIFCHWILSIKIFKILKIFNIVKNFRCCQMLPFLFNILLRIRIAARSEY